MKFSATTTKRNHVKKKGRKKLKLWSDMKPTIQREYAWKH